MSLCNLLRSNINCYLAKHSTVLRLNSSKKSAKKALLILATGAEEMETVIVADILRRAGVTLTIAGLCDKKPVKCMNGLILVPDKDLNGVKKEKFDAVILPGGFDGTMNIGESQLAGKILKNQEKACGIIAAICAAPLALKTHCIATGKCLTSYPGVKKELEKNYKYKDENVVVDGTLVTSRGPGTTFEFALQLAEILSERSVAEKVATDILVKMPCPKK